MADTISVISILEVTPSKELEEGSDIDKEEKVKAISKNFSYWNAFYALAILVVCTLATAIVTLIPRHNTIFYPEYWYEPMIAYQIAKFRPTEKKLGRVMEYLLFILCE